MKAEVSAMETRNAILKETRFVALGCVIGTALMVGIFAIIGRYDTQVLLGGIYGCAMAILNFFVLGMTVRKLADQALEHRNAETEEVDPDVIKAAKLKMQSSYMARMVIGIGLLILAIAVLKLNWITCMIPLLFPRAAIMVRQAGTKAGNIKGSDIK